MEYEPTPAELAALLARVRAAVEGERVETTSYAREGAAALEWSDWDIGEQLRELTARDWLRCDESRDPVWGFAVLWVFEPEFWDGGKLWIRLLERDGVLVVSFHKG